MRRGGREADEDAGVMRGVLKTAGAEANVAVIAKEGLVQRTTHDAPTRLAGGRRGREEVRFGSG